MNNEIDPFDRLGDNLNSNQIEYIKTIVACIETGNFKSDFNDAVKYFPLVTANNTVLTKISYKHPKSHFLFTKDGYDKYKEYCDEYSKAQSYADVTRDITKKERDKYIASEILKFTKELDEENETEDINEIMRLINIFNKKFTHDHNPPQKVVKDKLEKLSPNDKNLVEQVVDIMYPYYKIIVIADHQDQILRERKMSSAGEYDARLIAIGGQDVRSYENWEISSKIV